jgi:hypothetical protein
LTKNWQKNKSPVPNTWYSACGFQRYASVCGS